jgi:NitT/TauT family transport system ATP-binding protein
MELDTSRTPSGIHPVSDAQFVSIESVGFTYPGAARPALTDASLGIAKGEFACILGPSGCGKSTLLSILSGLAVPNVGRVSIDDQVLYDQGRTVTEHPPPLGYVFQDPRLLPWRTVRQNINLALKGAQVDRAHWDGLVDTYLGMCGLREYAEVWPGKLSGGQRQRVAIARALAIEPPSVLMDEPFSTLDEVTARFMRQELLDLWEPIGQTIVFVTHSIREAVFLADNVYVMSSGPGRVLERRPIDIPRPRTYEDPHLAEIEGELVDWVLEQWGYHDGPGTRRG